MPYAADAAVDVGSAFTAAFCASPFIMAVDKSVTQAASGTASLGTALCSGLKDVFLRPHVVLRNPALYLVAGVYAVTYATANSIDTVCERVLDPKASSTPAVHGTAKLVGVTAVNMSAGIAKDATFAKWFGAGDSLTRAVPRPTFGLFLVRDTLTIAAAFIVPGLVADAIVRSGKMDEKAAKDAAQIISPMGMQFICTPIHLLALNTFNAPMATVGERAKSIGALLPQSTLARMGRFCCAYGIGGLLNTHLLHKGRSAALDHYSSGAEPCKSTGLLPARSPVVAAIVEGGVSRA